MEGWHNYHQLLCTSAPAVGRALGETTASFNPRIRAKSGGLSAGEAGWRAKEIVSSVLTPGHRARGEGAMWRSPPGPVCKNNGKILKGGCSRAP